MGATEVFLSHLAQKKKKYASIFAIVCTRPEKCACAALAMTPAADFRSQKVPVKDGTPFDKSKNVLTYTTSQGSQSSQALSRVHRAQQ